MSSSGSERKELMQGHSPAAPSMHNVVMAIMSTVTIALMIPIICPEARVLIVVWMMMEEGRMKVVVVVLVVVLVKVCRVAAVNVCLERKGKDKTGETVREKHYKKRRNLGEEYTSYTTRKVMPAKHVGPPCKDGCFDTFGRTNIDKFLKQFLCHWKL